MGNGSADCYRKDKTPDCGDSGGYRAYIYGPRKEKHTGMRGIWAGRLFNDFGTKPDQMTVWSTKADVKIDDPVTGKLKDK